MNRIFNKLLFLARFARNRKIIPLIVLFQNEKVLDTSCGDGTFLKALYRFENNKEKECELFGVDCDQEVVNQAKKNINLGSFSVSKNDSLEFSDGNFDCVISSMTLHHMGDIKRSLGEMKRVCKSKGGIILVDAISFNKFSSLVLKITGKCPEPYHFEKFYSDKELEIIFEELGLFVEKKKKFYVFPGLGIVMPLVFFELKKIA